MSTHEDGPEASDEHLEKGLFEPHIQPTWPPSPRPSLAASYSDDDFGDASETTILSRIGAGPMSDNVGDSAPPPSARWHGGADLGLLVLRLAVGGAFVLHGLQHLFGWYHGIGASAFADLLRSYGYYYPTILSQVVGWIELVGGGLLVLGLFTPLAAAALLVIVANAIAVNLRLGFSAPQLEFDVVLAAATFTLLFARPGRISLDLPTPWYRHPLVSAWLCFLIAAAVTATALLKLR